VNSSPLRFPPPSPLITPACNRPSTPACQRNSFQQIESQTRETAFTLVTAEGDVVSLSNSQESCRAMAALNQTSPIGFTQQTWLTGFDAESMAMTVQGDLSDQELADIERLFTDLKSIAGDFFQGDLEAALAGATQIGDLGSIQALSATFRHTATVATRLDQSLAPAAPALAEQSPPREDFSLLRQQVAAQTSSRFSEALKAQWREFEEMLGKAATDNLTPPPQPPPAPAADTHPEAPATRLYNRLRQTMAVHPRLAPLGGPLLKKAVAEAMAEQQTLKSGVNDPTKHPLPRGVDDRLRFA